MVITLQLHLEDLVTHAFLKVDVWTVTLSATGSCAGAELHIMLRMASVVSF